MILVMRYAALRISDVVKLERASVKSNKVFLYTEKNGNPVYVWIPSGVQDALQQLSVPKGNVGVSRHFFWSGQGSLRAAIRSATRTLARVFQISGVEHGHAHRFRHTLATELLEAGATLEDVALILGNSPNTVRKHYAQFSAKRQDRIMGLLQHNFYGTNLTHEEKPAVSESCKIVIWWTAWGSNPRPPRCERGALPAELAAHCLP
jgi:site-specific recombinase XerD